VWDNNLEPVARDGATVGEIVMRGNNVMLGYYKNPKSTEESFAGGWFHSGDMAVMHPDGYIEIVDRKKDIIITGGENVSSIQVENAIYQHDGVLEVAVVSSPDPKWGEVPKAVVVMKPESREKSSEQLTKELTAHTRELLPGFKVPKLWEFVPELPHNATGKLQKNVLRSREWEGRQKKVN